MILKLTAKAQRKMDEARIVYLCEKKRTPKEQEELLKLMKKLKLLSLGSL